MHRLVRTFGLVCAGLFLALPATAQDLVITGVVDGPLPQGTPKAAEIYVINTIADLSTCGIGSASNGGGSDGQELTFSGSATAGDFLYVASEQPQFNAFFGFDPDFTGIALSVNGDDAIELFCGGSVIDTFGELTHSGPGAWNYQDGWAYRTSTTGADGSTFTIGNWTFSGANALDGESDNATATTPFPIGTYQRISGLAELLISEVVVTPTAGEYIEIYNPGSSAVDLTDVYLTDATFAGSPSTFYYNIVTGTNAGGGSFSDFHARFPNGASIAAGEYQTVSLNGSANFFATYGINPTYELYEDGTSADAIPDMLEATSGSINDQGGLTNSGEVAILYYWDGTSDLVQDLDYVVWGDKAEGVDKTGVSVDGPDADSTPSTFLDDTAIASQDVVSTGAHSSGNSFQRSDLAEGTETQTGGNGVQGDDETSENLSVTFTSSVAATPNAGNVVDNPPAVTAVNPADAATNVPVDTNVEITFSEGVTVTGTWFTISCTTSSDVTPANSAVTGGPVTYTIDPNTDFDGSDACTLTVFAAQVADTDGTPDNPTADFTSTFNTPAPPATLTIAEIQGAGNDSPQAGNTVTTSGNVVTAVVSNGFYMQSQPGNEDADPLTSEGIFVFTDGAPSVVEANVVTVTGTIEEFFSSTQFDDAGLSVQVTASEGILPAPIDLNTNTPSTTASVVPWFERYEGMLVTVANALVNAPTDRFGDTFLTVESTLRLREEGIEFPGQASLPVWDGNPELFEIDPNGVDQADVSFNVGGTVSATGPLSFQFGDYGIEAKSYTVGSTGDAVQAVRDAASGEVTIGSLNLFRLFASESDYQTRLAKFSLYIRTILKSPAILGVQECNSITELTALANRISTDGGPTYTPFLIEGNDVGGIDVGYLVDETQVANVSITQLGATETFTNPNNGQPSTTHDRPPLLLEGEFSASNPNTPISVLNIHSRSLGNIDDPTDGNRVRVKRHEQAKSIGNMMKARQTDNLVVIGDYNAFEFSDGFVDVLEQMSGDVGDANDSLIPYDAANAPTVPFTNQVVQQLPASERYSFFFSGNGQVLDHILTSAEFNASPAKQQRAGLTVAGLAYGRGNAGSLSSLISDSNTAARASDHDGVVVFLALGPALPVELAGFDVKTDGFDALLSWSTATETDNAGFAIELRDTACATCEFDEIGWVEGAGTTVEAQSYTFRATQLDPGTYAFRLRQVDFDGAFEYSPEVEATVTVPGGYLVESAYPNPFNPSTTVRFAVSVEQPVSVRIYNVLGELIRTAYTGPTAANQMQTVRVDAAGLSSGMYFVRVEGETFVTAQKVMLMK